MGFHSAVLFYTSMSERSKSQLWSLVGNTSIGVSGKLAFSDMKFIIIIISLFTANGFVPGGSGATVTEINT
jgi:hypothetical protein